VISLVHILKLENRQADTAALSNPSSWPSVSENRTLHTDHDDRQPDQNQSPEAGAPTLADRRRPGRAFYRNPHLIALLRSGRRPPPLPASVEQEDDDDNDRTDDLAAARGIAIAVILGLFLWLGVIWLLIRVYS